MVRTMRISFLALGLLGLYTTDTQAVTLSDAQEVLRTVNTYTPIIALGAVASVALGVWYTEHRQRKLVAAFSAINNELNAARQELIACRTWADEWCIPALDLLNVRREVLDNPATWTVYCSNLRTDRVLACARQLSTMHKHQLNPNELLCELTAGSKHATEVFSRYQTLHEAYDKTTKAIRNYGTRTTEQEAQELSYSIVMVPVYLRKIEFLKTLIKTRSSCITASANNQCCTSCCTSACHA